VKKALPAVKTPPFLAGPYEVQQSLPEAEESYLALLRDAIINGQHVENGWKPEFWTDCITAFRDKGFPISRQQLKNKNAVCN
jgi:hypothetical protein